MKPKSPTRNAVTVIALCLAVAMLVGGGWLMYRYWRTGALFASSDTITITPDMKAGQKGAPAGGGRGPGRNGGGGGGGRPMVAGINLGNNRSITGGRGNWRVTSGSYGMSVDQKVQGGPYEYHFTVDRAGAYVGDDLKLMNFAHDLTLNRQQIVAESKIAPAMLASLNNSPAQWLTFDLKVSQDLAAPVEALWAKYSAATATPADRDKIGSDLIEALHDAGDKALSANKKDYTDALTSVRTILPADQEKILQANVRAARNPRIPVIAPATRPALPATRPATLLAPKPAVKPPATRPTLTTPPATVPSTQP